MANRYAAGRRKEWELRNEYARTAKLVMRSAGSKGLADIVAFYGRAVYLLQVKYCAPGRAWKDKNWTKLCALMPSMPENVWALAYVYRRGTKKPEIYEAPR